MWPFTFALSPPLFRRWTDHYTGQSKEICKELPIPYSAAAQNLLHQSKQICVEVLRTKKEKCFYYYFSHPYQQRKIKKFLML